MSEREALVARLRQYADMLDEQLPMNDTSALFDEAADYIAALSAPQQEPGAVDTGNLANDPLYKSLDALYRRGWTDRSKERDYDPRGTIQWQETLDLFRRYTAALENKAIMEAKRPEPVAWLVQYRDRHEFTFKKPAFLIDAVAEPLYGPDLLAYALRMAAESAQWETECHNATMSEKVERERAENAERQLAEAEKREKSKHEQYIALLERHTKQTERLAELQAKHDALVKNVREWESFWNHYSSLAEDCQDEMNEQRHETLAAMSAVALNGGSDGHRL